MIAGSEAENFVVVQDGDGNKETYVRPGFALSDDNSTAIGKTNDDIFTYRKCEPNFLCEKPEYTKLYT
mgnify:CR=1 FL=1